MYVDKRTVVRSFTGLELCNVLRQCHRIIGYAKSRNPESKANFSPFFKCVFLEVDLETFDVPDNALLNLWGILCNDLGSHA